MRGAAVVLHSALCAPTLPWQHETTKTPKPQLLSKFSKIIQTTKTALTREAKVLLSPGKRPWKNSASPTPSFCSMDHETKRELYLPTSATTDKTKEKNLYSSVPSSTAQQRRSGSGSLLWLTWQQPNC